MIYLDHNATTPLDPEVLEAMLPYLSGRFGNPSCAHALGREARAAVDEARGRIADMMGCARGELIFTSGGSEANTMVFERILGSEKYGGRHIVIGGGEHPSIVAAARRAAGRGYEVSVAELNACGEVTADAVRAVVREDTALVSVMHAQNEVGTVNNLEEIAEVLGHKRILYHTDAAQSVGKIPTSFPFTGCNLMTIVPHKFYGPRGIGALIAHNFVPVEPLVLGGGQESGRRAGTENVAAIVGFAKALELAWGYKLAEQGEVQTALRDYLHLRISEEVQGVQLNGHPKDRLPTTLNLSFEGVSGRALVAALDEEGIAVSAGSACHEDGEEPSAVLMAMGLSRERALGAVRVSIGRGTRVEDADRFVDVLSACVAKLRGEGGELGAMAPPRCPRCERSLKVMSTSGGPLIACEAYDQECRHLLPLPGTRPPE